jgi:cytochrome c oxidase subunit IV
MKQCHFYVEIYIKIYKNLKTISYVVGYYRINIQMTSFWFLILKSG